MREKFLKIKCKISSFLGRKRREKIVIYTGDNTCIACGAIIPEGLMICPTCEGKVLKNRCQICGRIISDDMGNNATCLSCAAIIMNIDSGKDK